MQWEKYLRFCDAVDAEKDDATSIMMDEEDDVVRSLRTSSEISFSMLVIHCSQMRTINAN